MKPVYTTFTILCFANSMLPAQSFVLKTNEAGLSVVKKTNGVAAADYDRDGDVDIYFVANGQYNADDESTWNRFFRNEGRGEFSDVTAEANVISRASGQPFNEMGYKFCAAWGDYDNDGYPDIFLTNYGFNQLYHNQGNGTFVDVTNLADVAGVAGNIHSSAVWWDYDNDGDLDLFVSAWRGKNRMYENKGDGTFANVTEASGLANPPGTNTVTWTSMPIDGNNDGLLDLYMVEDFQAPNRFYVNRGDKTFREATREFGLISRGNGMGVAAGDYNNDGFFDIYVTNISGLEVFQTERNPLFTNTGLGSFVDKGAECGVSIAGWGWGTEFFDYDHDGDEDLYVVNGFDFMGNAADTTNFLFENLLNEGNHLFHNGTMPSGAEGRADGLGLVVFDYDNDGDLDLLVSNSKQEPYLYENQTPVQNWLKIELEGVESNRTAFGTVVKVTAAGKNYHRQYDGVDFLGQSILPVHFGIGNASMIDEITIRWPRGRVEKVSNLAANQLVKIREGFGIVTGVAEPPYTSAPETFQLLGSYPNPFNGETLIQFELSRAGKIELLITNVLGQPVHMLTQDFATAGRKAMRWDGRDSAGHALGSGIYYYRIALHNSPQFGKMLYLK
ncbi:MAG: FG-GAP-like repeat-containing protein [bacterium]